MRISVVIPCLNAAPWLEMAIRSALDQCDELFVVDSGSTDGSAGIAVNLAKAHSTIRVLYAPRPHACVARNVGWQAASGDWIQFLDADDQLEAGKIATQLREGDTSADFLVSPVIEEIWRDETRIARNSGGMTAPCNWFTAWIRWEVAQTGSVLWKREALEKINGWNEAQPRCQDNEITLRALTSGLHPAYTPTAGAVYRHWTETSISRANPTETILERTRLTDQMLDWLSASGRAEGENFRTANEMFFGLARTLARLNLQEATAYQQDRKTRGRWEICGPAAPGKYRLAARLFGFIRLERLAQKLRSPFSIV